MIKKFHENIFRDSIVYLLATFLLTLTLNACGAQPTETSATEKSAAMIKATALPSPMLSSPTPSDVHTPEPILSNNSHIIAEVEKQVGFDVKEPADLPKEYVLENAIVHEATKSVCLQYRYADPNGDNILLIAQGPSDTAPPLELIPDIPDYLALREETPIGGGKNSFHVEGFRRRGWACDEIATSETTRFSYAVAIRYAWEVDRQQFDLYSASNGCEAPGGVTNLGLLRVAESLTGESTHPADELDTQCLHSVADAEAISGFDVKEPAYLPQGASFYYATYETKSISRVTLFFAHNQHMSSPWFFITQTDDPLFFTKSCSESSDKVCETVQVENVSVVYQFHDPSEQLDWQSDGFFFSLFRSAGEPGKIYKDELLKIVSSMK